MENNPRPVDVAVSRPIGESYAGKDSQLDVAVRVGGATAGAIGLECDRRRLAVNNSPSADRQARRPIALTY